MQSIVQNLKENLQSVLTDNFNIREINELVRIAANFASVRLAQLIKNNNVNFDIQPHSINAIALDCIAELFRKDEDEGFIELKEYFNNDYEINKLTHEEITVLFRRLVFSKLKDGIFRIYREHDPILSKVIRNIKLAVKNNDKIRTFERFGETQFYIGDKEKHRMNLPDINEHELAADLIVHISGSETIGKQIELLLELLNSSDNYRNYISVVRAALVLKEIALKLYRTSSGNIFPSYENNKIDLINTFEKSIKEIDELLTTKYVAKSKMDKTVAEVYLKALKDMLYNSYIINNGVEHGYHYYIMKYDPLITYEDYRKNHRSKFEFIAKNSKKILLDNLRDEL